jgi:predicted DNA-binding transcriptional regulator AlpA
MNLITIDDIAALFQVGRRTVADHWIHRPDFPPPAIAPSRRTRRWDRDEIIAWATPAVRKSARQSPGSRWTAEGSSPDAR